MKKHLSVPVRISIRLTFVIALILSCLYLLFAESLLWKLTKGKSKYLEYVTNSMAEFLIENDVAFLDPAISSSALELSYYINYIVYDTETKSRLAYTDAYFPILNQTGEKTKRHIIKSYYIDGNLDVLYLTRCIKEKNLCLQIWVDIANDSLIKIISSAPQILPYFIIPVMILTYLVLFFSLSKAFNREHNFSANVSHELQTPVNAILGHANLLERWGKNDPEQVEKSLKVIINESHSMQATIKNLLQMTRLEEKQIQLAKSEIDIQDLFASIQSEFSLVDNLEIKSEINAVPEDGKILVTTDKELLHQIFVIAISNSIKFCPRPCEIILRYYTEGKNCIFEIQDNGKGFSKEIFPYIFDRFYRGDEAHSRSKGGAGLGLSIAKSIVTALDGKISAHNAKDNGAIIRIEIKK